MEARLEFRGGVIKKVDSIFKNNKEAVKSVSLEVPKNSKNKSKKTVKKIKRKKESKRLSLKRVFNALGIFLLVILIFLVLGFSSATLAHQYNSSEKSLHGVTFMGEDLGGLTKPELQRKITERLGEIKLNFKIDGEDLTFTPKEAGIIFDESLIATEALGNHRGSSWYQNFWGSSLSLIYKYGANYLPTHLYQNKKNIQIRYQLNEVRLNEFITELSKKYHIEERNAGLVMSGSTVQVIPAIYGKQLVTGAIRAQIVAALDTGEITQIRINTEEVNPEILEKDVQTSIAEAQRILENNIVLKYEDRVFQPTKSIIGGWIIFREKDGLLAPEVDSEKVKIYLNNVVAQDVNISPISEKVKITNGTNREVTREGKNGLAVNVSVLAGEIAGSLNAKKNFESIVPTYVVRFKTEVNNILVADWSKYIEISISRQEMCAYLRGGEKVDCWRITTGASRSPTPKGTFLIQRKSGAGGQPGRFGGGDCMPNPPSRTPLCGINYVLYFTSAGHAIHEAWWRSSTGHNAFGNPNFATNGSRGCVNATYDVAKFIYYWAPLGTPVVIH